ncbi:MAG: ElaD/SseL family deubiquitinase, partial [Plesiomonas sp.]
MPQIICDCSVNDIYNLTKTQFENLFSDDIDINYVNKIIKSASDGNVDSLDLLYNISLRQDDIGKLAEQSIFDLFSGKKTGKLGIESEIQKAGLRLYEMANNVNIKVSNNHDMRKLLSPSKLLYIVGSTIQDRDLKVKISNLFNRDQNTHSECEEIDLWASNRLTTSDEISSALHNIGSSVNGLSINYPIGLISNDSNLLTEQICGKISQDNSFDKLELFPINTGCHWVLFGLYKEHCMGKKEINAFLFNSSLPLSNEIKGMLLDSASVAGVNADKKIKWIEKDIQENVPNGCGVFVVTAVKKIIDSFSLNPAS